MPTSNVVPLRKEAGHASPHASGTLGSIVFDDAEETKELQWPASIRVYDRMRKFGKVRQTYAAATLPIRKARFFVRPNGARDEVVQDVAENLGLPIEGEDTERRPTRMRGRFSWHQHVRLALLHLIYGHMFFEQVYDLDEDSGLYRLHKLAPRFPQSISDMKVARDGGLEWIKQFPAGTDHLLGASGSIIGSTGILGGGKKLLVDWLVAYVHEQEGGNWFGHSILRACYMHWLLQQRAYRTDLSSKERFASPVPNMQAVESVTPAQLSEAQEIASRFRAGEFAGLATPKGFKLELVGISGGLPDALATAKHHGEEIPNSMLQQLLNLGHSEHGSRALGEEFTDVYHMSLQAILDELLDTANLHIVEDLVDVNFGEAERAPLIGATPIGTDQTITAESIRGLIEAGALKADKPLRAWLRDRHRMPAEDENEPEPPGEPVTARRRRRRQDSLRAAALSREPSPLELQAKTDFEAIQATWEDALAGLVDTWKNDVRALQIEELVAQITALVDAGDIDALGALSVETGAGEQIIAGVMVDLAEEAAEEAAREAGRQGTKVATPDLTRAEALLAKRAAATDQLLGSALSEAAGRRALAVTTEGSSGAEVATKVREHLEGLTDTYLTDQLGGSLTSAQNTGRFEVMREADPERFLASELLDAVTCENCADVDGREFDSLEDAEALYPTGGYVDCLGGPRCRGTIVAIYEGG